MAKSRAPQIPFSLRKQDWAYQVIRDRILTGEMGPGETIRQQELADELTVSRIPLRHALSRLAADGLVVDRPHQSWTVAEISVEDARDLYLGRAALEEALARAAANRVAESETPLPGLIGIEHVLRSQHDAARDQDRRELMRLDHEFHTRIYELARMPASLSALQLLRTRSDRYVSLHLARLDRAQDSLAEHEQILTALDAGDADRTAVLTRDHVLGGWCSLVASLEADEPPTTSG
ncbi:GntR family transcriptional regulator [Pseudonocardia sp. C8]|uniref:GntR family transcriptional regulator n=1 Tax=Pseudonocardia sp. C8 TaxID=2762759 RepID=UPI001642C60A|nr:GntR family transcriptional regulator [Pseudonocardia sp. C8]MBC3191091.1 GntR family transcriptional regulator [Pseudonocardia sp. C8]